MCKNLNNVHFLCTKLFQKGDTIQEGTLFKEMQYLNLRLNIWNILFPCMRKYAYISSILEC